MVLSEINGLHKRMRGFTHSSILKYVPPFLPRFLLSTVLVPILINQQCIRFSYVLIICSDAQ